MNSILWILRTALTILLILLLLVGVTWGGYLVVAELQRSMTSMATRTDAAESRIELLRSDVNTLVENNPDSAQQGEINSLQQQVAVLDGRLATLQQELNSDLNRQQQLLTDLQSDLTAVSDETTAQATAIATLQQGVAGLEADVQGANGRLDDLRNDLTNTTTDVTALQETAVTGDDLTAEMAEIQQTLTLFRVWQLITRARLRLVEANVGLATADVELALRTMDSLVAAYPDKVNDAWRLVQARLALAFLNLPDSPDLAGNDLETAWDELDGVLVGRIGLEIETAVNITVEPPVVSPTLPPAATPTATP